MTGQQQVVVQPEAVSNAVRYFWRMREKQKDEQKERGSTDQGNRGSATGGKHMHGFAQLLIDLMQQVGVDRSDIHIGAKKEDKDAPRDEVALPGYYRATKNWDLVVVQNGVLTAALEMKSQVGSIGNNANNRVAEALGDAEDIWEAYKKGKFGSAAEPWLGYLLLLEDTDAVHKSVAVDEPYFETFAEFRTHQFKKGKRMVRGTSYAKRYELFCRRVVLERKYSAAWFLLANKAKAAENPNYREPAADLTANKFVEGLLRRVAPLVTAIGTHARAPGPPPGLAGQV